MSNADDRKLSQRAHWAGGDSVVSVLMARALANPQLASLAAGFVDQATLPIEATRQAFEAIQSDPGLAGAALQYGTTIGYPALREAILERTLKADGRAKAAKAPTVGQVVITAGSNQLLYLLGDTLLDPGDIVLCGAPSYFVFMGALENLGARPLGVEVDCDGMVPEAVDEELARLDRAGELPRVKAIYITTYYDNPSGVSMPGPRREAMVEIARRWSRKSKIYLIEDAAYRELRYYGDDVPSLQSFDDEGDVVIHAGTFSKSYSPGIRVGWGILPRDLVEPVLAQKGNVDFGSPHFNQVLMSAVVRLGLFDRHVERLRESYRRKVDMLLEAADELLAPIGPVQWVRPTGGLYLWLRLPETIDTGLEGPLFERAVAEGTLYVPGACCYPQGMRSRHKNTLRLSFGAAAGEDIRRGVAALARAIQQIL